MLWVLLLTICMSDGKCVHQNVGLHTSQALCVKSQQMHEELPQDGSWSSINYECKLLNGEQA
jgi:hypothetical protein|tara:strand:+ start:596 stop:781 length:186 start_codon:yes stop_codon:yes gene_type:complete